MSAKPFVALALFCTLWMLPVALIADPASEIQNHEQTIARQAMIAALTEDNTALQNILKQEIATTKAAKEAGKNGSPALNKLLLLHVWSLESLADRERVLNTILNNAPSEDESRLAHHALISPLPRRLDNLRREDRFNRFAHTFNFFAKLTTSLITANVQTFIHHSLGIFFIGQRITEVSPHNRAEYDLYRTLQNNPHRFNTLEAQAVSQSKQLTKREKTLADRIAKRTALEETVRGEWNLRHENWHQARAAFSRAQELAPSGRAQKGQLEAAQQISAQFRTQVLSAEMPVVSEAYSPEEIPAARQLALALCDGSLEEIRDTAIKFQSLEPHSALRDDAAYAELTAHQLLAPPDKTHCDEIPRLLLEHPSMHETNASRHLAARESSPYINSAIRLAEAEKQRKADKRRYIFLGDLPDYDGPRVFTLQDKINRAVNTVGILLPVQWVIRAVITARKKPVDDGPWRDAAIQYLAQTSPNPQSPTFICGPANKSSIRTTDSLANQTALQLALSYEKGDRFSEARKWYTLAEGTLPEEVDARLSERSARLLLARAREIENPMERKNQLEYILKYYAQTPGADKARKELSKAGKSEEETAAWQVTKKDLAERPDMWMGQGLWLNAEWFDNGKSNGELRNEGVRFLDMEGTHILFTIDEPQGPVRYSLKATTPETREEYKATLETWKRELASRRRAAELFERPSLPMSLDASAGPGGFDIYPLLIPLPFDSETLPLYK